MPQTRRAKQNAPAPTSEVGLAASRPQNVLLEEELGNALERVRKLEAQLLLSTSTASTSAQNHVRLPLFDPVKPTDPEGSCKIVDLWVEKQKPNDIDLVIALSAALKGEAASWLISAKPTEKNWSALRAEFLAVFARPIDPIEQFSEAVCGRQNLPDDVSLLDEMLHSMRTILGLMKNRESDEAFCFALRVCGISKY